MQMRSTFKDEFLELHGVKLGFMSAFVKVGESAGSTASARSRPGAGPRPCKLFHG